MAGYEQTHNSDRTASARLKKLLLFRLCHLETPQL